MEQDRGKTGERRERSYTYNFVRYQVVPVKHRPGVLLPVDVQHPLNLVPLPCICYVSNYHRSLIIVAAIPTVVKPGGEPYKRSINLNPISR